MKVSPYGIKRQKRVLIDAEFVSADGTIRVPMPLRKLTQMELVSAMDFAVECTEVYITGSGEPGKKGFRPPRHLAPVDGEPVFLSASTCQVAAILWRAQVSEDAERYSFEEIASFMVDDAILNQMTEIVGELKQDEVPATDPLAVSGSTSSDSDSIST